jgi:hypothetical protein
MSGDTNRQHGEAFYGSKGTNIRGGIGYEGYFENDMEPPVRQNPNDATSVHSHPVVACMRGAEKPRSNVLPGHRVNIVSHLGNLAVKLRQKIHRDGKSERITGAPCEGVVRLVHVALLVSATIA